VRKGGSPPPAPPATLRFQNRPSSRQISNQTYIKVSGQEGRFTPAGSPADTQISNQTYIKVSGQEGRFIPADTQATLRFQTGPSSRFQVRKGGSPPPAPPATLRFQDRPSSRQISNQTYIKVSGQEGRFTPAGSQSTLKLNNCHSE
jgi:hypothetical protein